MIDVAEATRANDVAQQVEALYGDPLTHPAGVLHVTSVWERPTAAGDGTDLVTLRIDEHAPPSRHDFFVLNLCRARADAIVVSGKILRDEPEVRHTLQGPAELPEALAAWRREQLSKSAPPISAVLTSGRGLDLDHPLFASAHRPTLFTTPDGWRALEEAATQRGIGAVTDPAMTLRKAIDYLQSQGARTISIECGPRTSAGLYDAPVAVDELLLSVFEGELPSRSQGAVLRRRDELEELLERQGPGARRRSESGPWRFERFLRLTELPA